MRAIVPPPVRTPRILYLDFTRPAPGTILDVDGHGIGLSSRLPGTGTGLPERDPNLRLCPDRRALELTTTRSDLNTQERPVDRANTWEFGSPTWVSPARKTSRSARHIPDIPGLEGGRSVRPLRRIAQRYEHPGRSDQSRRDGRRGDIRCLSLVPRQEQQGDRLPTSTRSA